MPIYQWVLGRYMVILPNLGSRDNHRFNNLETFIHYDYVAVSLFMTQVQLNNQTYTTDCLLKGQYCP